MEIRIDGSLSRDEFLQTVKLINRPTGNGIRFSINQWTLILLAGLALIAVSVGGMLIVSEYFSVEFIGTLLGAFLVTIGLKLRTAMTQLWDKNEAFRARREGMVTEECIELHNPTMQVRYQWNGFTGYGEYQDVIVLFQDTTQALPFSKRFFQSEADWDQFKSLVASRISLTHRINNVSRVQVLVWLIIIISVALLAADVFGNR